MADIPKLFRRKAIQGILEVDQDGIRGPKTNAAWEALWIDGDNEKHPVIASSFADAGDIAAFWRWFHIYKELGHSDAAATRMAFRKGDNAIGYYETSTATGTGPCCALPPDDIIEKWGSLAAGKFKNVWVSRGDYESLCVLKDIMPPRNKITTRARIDLNPDAGDQLHLHPPFMAPVVWWWT